MRMACKIIFFTLFLFINSIKAFAGVKPCRGDARAIEECISHLVKIRENMANGDQGSLEKDFFEQVEQLNRLSDLEVDPDFDFLSDKERIILNLSYESIRSSKMAKKLNVQKKDLIIFHEESQKLYYKILDKNMMKKMVKYYDYYRDLYYQNLSPNLSFSDLIFTHFDGVEIQFAITPYDLISHVFDVLWVIKEKKLDLKRCLDDGFILNVRKKTDAETNKQTLKFMTLDALSFNFIARADKGHFKLSGSDVRLPRTLMNRQFLEFFELDDQLIPAQSDRNDSVFLKGYRLRNE